MASIFTVVESYEDYLFSLGTKLGKQFRRRRCRKQSLESAIAEAAVFRVLEACHASPEVTDMPGKGGPDFLCAKGTADHFQVEATSFTLEKVTDETFIEDLVPEGAKGQAYGLLTKQMEEKAVAKISQLKGIGMPGVLAIASTHFGAPLVFDERAAENALLSEPFFVHGRGAMTIDFTYSLFLRLDDGQVVPKNECMSAAIFVAIGSDRSYVYGALHPSPEHKLKSERLWQIPFICLKDWPVEGSRVRTAWTMGTHPSPYEVVHAAIRGTLPKN